MKSRFFTDTPNDFHLRTLPPSLGDTRRHRCYPQFVRRLCDNGTYNTVMVLLLYTTRVYNSYTLRKTETSGDVAYCGAAAAVVVRVVTPGVFRKTRIRFIIIFVTNAYNDVHNARGYIIIDCGKPLAESDRREQRDPSKTVIAPNSYTRRSDTCFIACSLFAQEHPDAQHPRVGSSRISTRSPRRQKRLFP